jgi:glycosyltransferase involved in cell wall biosynthesis
MASTIKVSVVIPIKGRASLFVLTAESLVEQTYPHWEAVVVDDGSSADEFDRIGKIADRDRRMRLMKNPGPRRGASACRNAGLAASRGEYVVFLDSDDALAPTCLERRVEVMQSKPNLDFAVFPTRVFHAIPGDSPLFWNQFTSENDLDRFLHFDLPWHTSGPIWKKTSLLQQGPWDDRALCAQDWEFHIRAIAAGLSYIKVPEPDSFWRAAQAGSISSSWTSRRHLFNRLRLIKRMIALLRSEGELTTRRRRILASWFYVAAFGTRGGSYHSFAPDELSSRMALKIWCTGRRTRVVGTLQFVAALACECAWWIVRRANRLCERLLFPELRLPKTHLLATTSAPPEDRSPDASEPGKRDPLKRLKEPILRLVKREQQKTIPSLVSSSEDKQQIR